MLKGGFCAHDLLFLKQNRLQFTGYRKGVNIARHELRELWMGETKWAREPFLPFHAHFFYPKWLKLGYNWAEMGERRHF